MSALKDRIRALNAADPSLSGAEIARRLGCVTTTVWKALNPEKALESDRATREKRRERRREVDREYKRRQRAVCETCGGPCGIGSADKSRQCRVCFTAAADARVEEVARLYNAGASYEDIQAALGWTGTPGMLLRKARQRGLIGYRYAAYEKQAA